MGRPQDRTASPMPHAHCPTIHYQLTNEVRNYAAFGTVTPTPR
ncbi:hypothetical protein [Tolypothrix sp. VBCCA 56010]